MSAAPQEREGAPRDASFNPDDEQALEGLFRRLFRGDEISDYELGFLQGIIALDEYPALALAAMRNYETESSFQPGWALQHGAVARPDLKSKLAKHPRDYPEEAPRPLGRTETYGETREEVLRSQSEGWADTQLVMLFSHVPSHEADLEFRRVLREERRQADLERLRSMDDEVSKQRKRGHTRKEIAGELGLTESAVQRSFSRLRRRGTLN